MLGTIFGILKLSALKARYGKRLVIKNIRQRISCDTEIRVGNDAVLSLADVNTGPNVHLVCEHGEMDIGAGVIFNRNCIVVCHKRISIGDRSLFGPNICIFDHDHVFGTGGAKPDQFECSDIVIESGCWLGAGVVVLRGTHIGANSVIEAGKVIKGNIPPNSIVMSAKDLRIIPMSFLKRDKH